MEQQTKKLVREVSLKTILAAVLFLLSVGLFALIADEIVFENEDWFDTQAFLFFKEHSSPFLIHSFKIITFFGSSYFLFPAYGILTVLLLWKKHKWDAINILIMGITSTLLMFLMKNLFKRHRPDLPLFKALTNYSFPSGHALSSFIFCSMLIWLAWKSKWKNGWKWLISVLLILFSAAIGISRIVLRYHYASDVLAGFCLAFAWVLLSLWLQKKFRPQLKKAAAG